MTDEKDILSVGPDGGASASPKENRRNYRFDEKVIRAISKLTDATGIENETSVVSLAIHYAARHVPPQLAIKAQELREMQPSIIGFAAVLHAFYNEAERVMREEGVSPDEIRIYSAQFLFDLGDPFSTTSLLLEKIEDRPVWLRHSWKTPYQYNKGKDLLESTLGNLDERYSKSKRTQDWDHLEEEDPDEGGAEAKVSASLSEENYDAEGDGDEPSIRLYAEDIYALYNEVTILAGEEKEDVFLCALQRSLVTLLPRLKKGARHDNKI